MTRTAVSGPCSRVTSRAFTAVRVHPEWLSPVRSRTMSLDFSSRKMAMPSGLAATVPTRARRGRLGSLPRMDCCGAAAGGGRRDGEKIGRSRVAVNDAIGIAHNGFGRSIAWGGQSLPAGNFAAGAIVLF